MASGSWGGVKPRAERIARATVEKLQDGSTYARIEWGDGAVSAGPMSNPHIAALVGRAEREGKPVTRS